MILKYSKRRLCNKQTSTRTEMKILILTLTQLQSQNKARTGPLRCLSRQTMCPKNQS